MRSDWLLKLQISFVIHLRATRAGFASENIVSVAGQARSATERVYLPLLKSYLNV